MFLLIIFFFSLLSFEIASKVKASQTEGAIEDIYKYAKGVDDPGVLVNFNLFTGSLGVIVTDTDLKGFAWGNKIGWINLSPSNGGVLNDTEGTLSGYAVSESGGWWKMAPL